LPESGKAGAPVIVALALCPGALLWWAVPAAFVPVPRWAWILVLICAVACFVPACARSADQLLQRIRDPSPRNRAIAGCVIAIVCSSYLVFTASRQDRDFFPKGQDDQSYVIQMRQLAQGRLWMPQHPEPMPDFFDSFHVIVRPVYASAYFPGTAMIFVPLVWLGLPVWIGPIIAAGAIVGMTYRIITELVDGVSGILASLLIISPNWFRMLSLIVMAQLPALLLGLILIWAWLRWRKSARRRVAWAVVMGIAAGWMAITRPVDAIAYILPVAVAVVLQLRRIRRVIATLAAIVAGAAPFIAVQLIQNVGITGHLMQSPFGTYIARDQPRTGMTFAAWDPGAHPESVVPQKQRHYETWVRGFIERHAQHPLREWKETYFGQFVDATLPARVLLVLVPIGLIGISRDRRRWVLLATLPLFLGLYFFYTFYLEHYAVVVAPAMTLMVVLAPRVLREIFSRIGAAIDLAVSFAILILSLSMLPELNHHRLLNDESFRSPMMRVLHDQLPRTVTPPAVVLFRYDPSKPQSDSSSPHIEPVYNTDVAWPDDAPIVRAHDLGSRDIEIFRYYAEHQPDRNFYLFDRGNLADPLHYLGQARDLARHAATTTTPSP
jgi:hypothetical protein